MHQRDRWGTGCAVASVDPQTLVGFHVASLVGTASTHVGPAIGADGIAYYGTDWPAGTNRFRKFDASSLLLLPGEAQTYGVIRGMPAIGERYVYFQIGRTNQGMGRVVALDPDTMQIRWSAETRHFDDSNQNPSPILGPDGDVLFAAWGRAWKFDGRRGTLLWRATFSSDIDQTPRMTRDDRFVLVSFGSEVVALDYTTGAKAWSTSVGFWARGLSVAPSGTVLVGRSGGRLVALTPDKGRVLWTCELSGDIASPAYSPDGKVAYVAGGRLWAVEVETGRVLWEAPAGSGWAPVVDSSGTVFVLGAWGDLSMVSPEGVVTGTASLGYQAHGHMSIAADGTMFAGRNTIQVVRRTVAIGGRFQLGDLIGPRPTSVPVKFYEANGDGPYQETDVPMAVDGRFQPVLAVRPRFKMSIQLGTFLRRVVSLDVRSTGDLDLTISLLNGDTNGDNSVNVLDFLRVRRAYGSTPGSPHWDPRCDLNGDGRVGLEDFQPIRRNFGTVGDDP